MMISTGAALMAATTALLPPTLGDRVARNLQQAYPAQAMQDDRSAWSELSLQTDPEGRIYNCRIVRYFGDRQLAGFPCAFLQRARIEPARDAGGKPTYCAIRTALGFFLPDTSIGRKVESLLRGGSSADMLLTVSALPAKYGQNAKSQIAISVSLDGKMQRCEPNQTATDSDPALVTAACNYLSGQSMPVLNDRNGNPVAYVRAITIGFDIDHSDGSGETGSNGDEDNAPPP